MGNRDVNRPKLNRYMEGVLRVLGGLNGDIHPIWGFGSAPITRAYSQGISRSYHEPAPDGTAARRTPQVTVRDVRPCAPARDGVRRHTTAHDGPWAGPEDMARPVSRPGREDGRMDGGRGGSGVRGI
ncbi:hypothetical protein GCM10017559_83620 [Streptosporangium longisporum]|uniref:Tn3 transposase DDE domain-containing protein n=1 Tax=Streptosporangium longisporum TaxID=46187 RepID=A0ABP6LIX8_9ACTN